jgi:hypothetical protein
VRALLAAALILAPACTSTAPTLPTPSPTAEPGVLVVTALLDLSGPRAQVGAQQRSALQLWLEQQGRGTAVRLETVDVAGSEGRLLIELRRAATETLADAVIVGASVGYDDTLGRAIDLAALPVLLLQPIATEPAGRPGGRWAFALAPSTGHLARVHIDDARRRDVLVPSILLSDRRERIDPMAAALNAESERRGLGTLTHIELANDGTIPPVVRSSLSVLKSVHCLVPPAVCSAIAREARAIGSQAMLYLPFATSAADQMRDDRDLAARAVWPSSAALLGSAFGREYSGRHGSRPDIHAALAHDAMTLVGLGAERGGRDDRAALRDAIEGITMPLIATAYSFRADRRTGWDAGNVAYMRWDGGGAALAPLFGTVAPTPTPTPTPARPTAAP